LPIRDSNFLKVAHRTQWREEGGQTGRRPGHRKSETRSGPPLEKIIPTPMPPVWNYFRWRILHFH